MRNACIAHSVRHFLAWYLTKPKQTINHWPMWFTGCTCTLLSTSCNVKLPFDIVSRTTVSIATVQTPSR
jgi:hypothetical protein